jgi:N,N-dimethylformamidase beta subunit-like, C-terminal
MIRAYAHNPSIECGEALELCVEPGAHFRVSIFRAESWQLVTEVDGVFSSGQPRAPGLIPHTSVGRTPASAADPLVGYSDLVKASTGRARAPGAGQGTRPTNSMRKWKSMWHFAPGLPDPACDRDWNWPSVSIPLDLPSAVYFALVHEVDGDATQPGRHLETNAAMFVVAPKKPSAAIAYIVPVATMHAYNFTGGGCFYEYRNPHAPPSRTVTWRRPGCGIGGESREVPDPYDAASPRQAFAHWDAKMIAWLGRNGFAIDCYTDIDLDRREILTGYRLTISAGHHEYWSEPMRHAVERLLDTGGNAAIFSGNTCYRKVSFDHVRATIAKENEAWPGSNEAALLGVGYSHGGGCWAARPPNGYTVLAADHWVFENVPLPPDGVIGAADRLLGYECDGVVPGVTPACTKVLASGRLEGGWNNGEGHVAAMVILESRRGTLFNAATTDWARILGDPTAESHRAVAGITHNVVKRLSCTTTP